MSTSGDTQNERGRRPPVTTIGLGLMGSALAEAFLDHGFPTTVWNRSADKADDLLARGANGAVTSADAVRASELVITCVRDYDAVREALYPAGEALAGRALINLTSGSSDDARVMAAWAADLGADYLDGAIMMTPPGIGRADTAILYSGPRSVFEAHEETLRTLGGATEYVGEYVGLASLYDVALLGMMWATLNGFLHGVALVGKEDVEATTFLPLATSWLGGISSFLPGIAHEVDAGEFTADEATLETQLPPIKHLVHESEARGIDAELPRYTQRLIERAIGDGHAADSYARIIEHFRAP